MGVGTGIIVMWHGALVDIPDGWLLCDGTSGTPDLTDKFIFCVAAAEDPGATGGNSTHDHTFSADAHDHNVLAGSFLDQGNNYDEVTDTTVVTGTTDSGSGLPPYYKLAFLMKS